MYASSASAWGELTSHRDHVYRCHALNQCKRCGELFQSKDLLRKHRDLGDPCQRQEFQVAEGYDSQQEDKLRKKRRTNDHSQQAEETQWFEMYKILFQPADGNLIPSPCK
jgi:hypothetical protein